METYLIITAFSSLIIGLCKVLSMGKFIRLWQYKRLYPNSTLEEVKECEKQSKNNYYFFPIKKSES
jgi:hypothetical protein